MKLFQTDQGLARQHQNKLAILDIQDTYLDAILVADKLAWLAHAPVRTYVSFDQVSFEPIVNHPGRFVIAGLNYRAHCEEIGRPVPEKLMFGIAPGIAVHASGKPVQIPAKHSDEIDYEGEIAVVMSKSARNVTAADAWSYVAGLAPVNDVSARDVQAEGSLQAVGRAKGFATFKPLGPCLATLDEFTNPFDIELKTRVNGELRQQGRTIDMVFSIPKIIEIVTAKQALDPGDVICTGTPGGVAHGGKHPYLKSGDTVEIEIEGLPPLTNVFLS